MNLQPHQKDGIRFMLSHDKFALFWKMRIRKTIPVLRVLKIRNAFPALIVTVNSAADEWERQALDNGFTPEDIVLLNKKNKKIKKNYLTLKCKLFILNYEGYIRYPHLHSIGFESVILDESHKIKNPQAKVTKFYLRTFSDVQIKGILTGTPAPENELEYWSQLRFLDPFSIPYDYYRFRFKFFNQQFNSYTINAEGVKMLGIALKKYAHFLDYHDLYLPELNATEVRTIQMNDKCKAIYNRLYKEFMLETEHFTGATVYATKRHIWLRQFIGGFVNQDFINNSKLDELQYLIKTEMKGERIIIWATFNDEVEYLAGKLHCDFVHGDISLNQRSERIDKFQAGLQKYIVCQPACFAHGGKLDTASAQVYYSLPESGTLFEQSSKRFIDIDQKYSKLTLILITENTIDEIVWQSARTKQSFQKLMSDYVKRK